MNLEIVKYIDVDIDSSMEKVFISLNFIKFAHLCHCRLSELHVASIYRESLSEEITPNLGAFSLYFINKVI